MSVFQVLFPYQVTSEFQLKCAAISDLFHCWYGAVLYGAAEHCTLIEKQFKCQRLLFFLVNLFCLDEVQFPLIFEE